jgi:hypothetical protein
MTLERSARLAYERENSTGEEQLPSCARPYCAAQPTFEKSRLTCSSERSQRQPPSHTCQGLRTYFSDTLDEVAAGAPSLTGADLPTRELADAAESSARREAGPGFRAASVLSVPWVCGRALRTCADGCVLLVFETLLGDCFDDPEAVPESICRSGLSGL